MGLFAARDILPLTDLSINYGPEWWRQRPFPCACGWKFCRHKVLG
jgi:SET domain-containing protein